MITLDKINENGLAYIAMFIEDAVKNEGRDEKPEHGMYFDKFWATPETCYWLYTFLKEVGEHSWNKEIIERLRQGTNNPENI